MDRRDFIRQTGLACGAIVAGASLLNTACKAPQNVMAVKYTEGHLIVPLSAFGNERIKVVQSDKFKETILLVKNPNNSYEAVLMKCTHKGAQLKLEGSANLKCPLHGSLFTYHGAVLQGPAKTTLRRFPVEASGDFIKVNVG